MPKDSPSLHHLTGRSVIIGLLFVVLFCFIVPYNDFFIEGTFLAGNHFPIGSMFILIFILVNQMILLMILLKEKIGQSMTYTFQTYIVSG